MHTPESLRARRKELGMTQAQLASALEVSNITISNWERSIFSIPRDLVMPDALGTGRATGKVCAATHPQFYAAAGKGLYVRTATHPHRTAAVHYDVHGRFWLADGIEVFSGGQPPATPLADALERAEETGDFADVSRLFEINRTAQK